MSVNIIDIPIDDILENMIASINVKCNFTNLIFIFYGNPDKRTLYVDVSLTSDNTPLVKGTKLCNMQNVFYNNDYPFMAMPINIVDEEELTLDNYKEKFKFFVWV